MSPEGLTPVSTSKYEGKSISKVQIDVGYYMFERGIWGYRH
jgi:hypothetical protein